MEEESDQTLDWFFDQWLFSPGYPVIEGEWSFDPDESRVTVTFRQTQTWEPFELPLDVGMYFDGRKEPVMVNVNLDERTHTFVFETKSRPSRLALDPNTWVLMENRFNH